MRHCQSFSLLFFFFLRHALVRPLDRFRSDETKILQFITCNYIIVVRVLVYDTIVCRYQAREKNESRWGESLLFVRVRQGCQESAIIVAAATIRDQPMLPATIGVKKSAIRQFALIRQVVLSIIGTTAGVVEHLLAAVRINRTIAKRASVRKEIQLAHDVSSIVGIFAFSTASKSDSWEQNAPILTLTSAIVTIVLICHTLQMLWSGCARLRMKYLW